MSGDYSWMSEILKVIIDSIALAPHFYLKRHGAVHQII